jgi:hypothetical protein
MLCAFAVAGARAGQTNAPAAPTSPASAMYTVEDIYNKLNGSNVAKRAGGFTEPVAGPGSTGHTLDDIMALVTHRAPVAKTGQTTLYAAGDDGALQRGVAWPTPRFTDNLNGTVTDNLSGLIWLKKANYIGSDHPAFDADGTAGDGRVTWQHALDFVSAMNAGTYANLGFTDWRLPNVQELQSLIDHSRYNPSLCNTAGTGQWTASDPFTGVLAVYYWSSTGRVADPTYAWYVSLYDGFVSGHDRSTTLCVWPVRGRP